MKPRHIIVVFFLIIVLFVLGFVTRWSVLTVTVSEQKKAGEALSTVLNTSHQALLSWAKENQETAQIWAESQEVIKLTQDLLVLEPLPTVLRSSLIQAEVREFLGPVFKGKNYFGYFIVGPNGINLASSRDSNLGNQNLIMGQTEFLEKLWAGENSISLPQYSEIPLPNENGLLQEIIPTMFVGSPIKDKNHIVIAVLLFRIDPKEDFTRILQRGQLGETGETYAFNSKGDLISDSRFDQQLVEIGLLNSGEAAILNIRLLDPQVNLLEGNINQDKNNLPVLTRMAQSAIGGEASLDVEGYRDYRGVEVIGAWLWDKKFGYGITTEIDKEEYFEGFTVVLDTITHTSYFAAFLLSSLTVLYIISDRQIGKRTDRIRVQLAHQRALRDIDIAISSSQDMEKTLEVVIGQICDKLNLDAASVLVSDENDPKFYVVAYQGFHTVGVEDLSLLPFESLAGKVASESKALYIPDFSRSELDIDPALSEEEGFKAYFSHPLLAKERVVGVLETFMRKPFEPDGEWLELLETFAGQVAIAVENAQLFEGLKHRNIELSMAYDSTLEGWAKALELRDDETIGHSKRVTELTIRLAKMMGISDDQLVHIRRGAILHDIGKMGIPDHILLKPGKLDKEEWKIMKKHADYAYEWLWPILFLRPALDIPYAHHEKWDGTGYPRKLKGEDIPVSARIFAIIDVWDALRSNRPYRDAWSETKSLEYIKEQSGSHFDPQAYEAFISMMEEDSN